MRQKQVCPITNPKTLQHPTLAPRSLDNFSFSPCFWIQTPNPNVLISTVDPHFFRKRVYVFWDYRLSKLKKKNKTKTKQHKQEKKNQDQPSGLQLYHTGTPNMPTNVINFVLFKVFKLLLLVQLPWRSCKSNGFNLYSCTPFNLLLELFK